LSICRLLVVLAVLVIWLVAPHLVFAQSAENVAVVVNDASDASRRIAEHYIKARAIPPANVFRIRTLTGDTIERAEYARTIEGPLGLAIRRAGLQDRIQYIVLTKGIPLRIAGTSGANGTVASVDSELTLLYRRLVGVGGRVEGRIDNPYYLGTAPIAQAKPFSHREHDIYLVTRLDAFSVEQTLALIDRAQMPVREGRIMLDQRGTGSNGDQWMAQAAGRLKEAGHGERVLLATSPKAALNAPVLGYYSWGAADPENQVRKTGMNFVPGAIAANFASFDARTFQQPPDAWRPTGAADKSQWFEGAADALIGDLIGEGVTGIAGQVDEAYPFGAVRPDILFPAYISGFNLVEAFYLAIPALSWQTVVIGDPLCAPFGRKPLLRDELEEPVDESTGYPGLFGKRRAVFVKAANPDVPVAGVPALMRAQALQERAADAPGIRQALTEVLAVAPRAVGPLVTLAQLDERAGDHDSAIDRYRIVIEVQPNHALALNNLAYALAVKRNAPAEALAFADRAVRLSPGSGVMLDTFAWIQHLLGNNELAAKLLNQAVRLEPAHPEIRVHAAVVYMAIGNKTGAATELKQALALDPGLINREDVQRLRVQGQR
jgi:uncharacterized protein (TIGR03790 family)